MSVKPPPSSEPQALSMEEILASIRRIVTEEPEDAANEANKMPKTLGKPSDVLELTQMVTEDGKVVDVSQNSEPTASEASPPVAAAVPTPPPSHTEPEVAAATPEKLPSPLEEEGHPLKPTIQSDFKTAAKNDVVSTEEKTAKPEGNVPSSIPSKPLTAEKEAVPTAVQSAARSHAEEDFSQAAVSQISEAFQSLTQISKANSSSSMLPATKTIEDITREILAPYLQGWMQENIELVIRKMLKKWLEQNLPLMVEKMVAEQIQRLTQSTGDL